MIFLPDVCRVLCRAGVCVCVCIRSTWTCVCKSIHMHTLYIVCVCVHRMCSVYRHLVMWIYLKMFGVLRAACCVPRPHRGDVLRRELVGGVGDEQAGFPHGAVAHHYTLYGLHLRERRTRRKRGRWRWGGVKLCSIDTWEETGPYGGEVTNSLITMCSVSNNNLWTLHFWR